MDALPNDSTLVNIHTILARQGQILENVTQDLREVRDDVKDIRMALKDYMPRSEAKLQFDAMQALILSMQAQMTDLQTWRMSSALATVREINDAKADGKKDVGEVEKVSLSRIISVQGTIFLVSVGFILWIIEQFLVNAHIFGK